MALSRVELNVHPFGLGGGLVLSGSATVAFTDAYQYYPITACTTTIVMNMPQTGSLGYNTVTSSFATSFTAGMPVYGPITQVTQSSGLAIVYKGVVTPDPGAYRL